MSIRGAIRTTVRPAIRGAVGVDGGNDPRIILQPVDSVVALGDDAVFAMDARGTQPIAYQWWEYTFTAPSDGSYLGDIGHAIWTHNARTLDGMEAVASDGSYLGDIGHAIWTEATRTLDV